MRAWIPSDARTILVQGRKTKGQTERAEPMKKNLYDAGSLERVLVSFEERYGMTSADFYALHRSDVSLDMPGFHRHAWASFYREVRRLRGDDFAENAERLLTLA
jgi:hypothetical protein